MFPIQSTLVLQEFNERIRTSPRGAPSTRLDVYRYSLENKRMMHLDTLRVEDRQRDFARAYARREQLALANSTRITMTFHVRNSIAAILLNAGERIRASENHAPASNA